MVWPSSWPLPESGLLPDCSHLEDLPTTDPSFNILWDWWKCRYSDIMVPAPEELPPFREVNHRIALIDPSKRYVERRATCPQSLESELRMKVSRYERADWWVARPSAMACPLLCLAKKDSLLRTVVDARNRNANTVLDVTPMPDMRFLMDSLACNMYRSKIDMTDEYEQIRVEPDCVPLTAFSVPWGTYLSNVLQQGDYNGPSTFQH